ncbi:hypothetical protein NL676_030526 [Syzygium grande]|nr:hypothetical protein NL676_030526 [Syzygium grande]
MRTPGCGVGKKRYLFSSDVVATVERYNEMADCVMAKAKKICHDFGEVAVETRVENGDERDMICAVAQKLVPDFWSWEAMAMALSRDCIIWIDTQLRFVKCGWAFLRSMSYHCAQNVKCRVLAV